MKYKTDIFALIGVLLYCTNFLFKYFLPGEITKILPILAVVFSLVGILSHIMKTRIYKPLFLLLLFTIWWALGSLYSVTNGESIWMSQSMLIALIFIIFNQEKRFPIKPIVIYILIVCSLFGIGLILQMNNVSFLHSLYEKLYTSEQVSNIESWGRRGWYSGFFPDRATAAFYSILIIGASIYLLIQSKDKWYIRVVYLLFIGYGLYCVFLTAKRGLLLGLVLSFFIVFLLYRKLMKKPIFKTVVFMSSIIVFFVLLAYVFPSTSAMFDRIFESGDITTGRVEIYENMLKIYDNHFILGIGTGSVDALLGIGGHNIYLNVLVENGLIGFTIFLSFVLSMLIISIKRLFDFNDKQNIAEVIFSLFIQCFFIIYGMTGNPLYDNYILNTYFLAIIILIQNVDLYETGGLNYEENWNFNTSIS